MLAMNSLGTCNCLGLYVVENSEKKLILNKTAFRKGFYSLRAQDSPKYNMQGVPTSPNANVSVWRKGSLLSIDLMKVTSRILYELLSPNSVISVIENFTINICMINNTSTEHYDQFSFSPYYNSGDILQPVGPKDPTFIFQRILFPHCFSLSYLNHMFMFSFPIVFRLTLSCLFYSYSERDISILFPSCSIMATPV